MHASWRLFMLKGKKSLKKLSISAIQGRAEKISHGLPDNGLTNKKKKQKKKCDSPNQCKVSDGK